MGCRQLSTYRIEESYQKNLEMGPKGEGEYPHNLPQIETEFLDFTLNSPLGIPAGLLLDSRWIEYYAKMGFDLLTYKTVRSREHPSHPMPNCLFVKSEPIFPNNLPQWLPAPDNWEPEDCRKVTITNSFGMPSRRPQWWQEDVERSLGLLKDGQLLVVSVVGSYEGTEEGLVRDFERVVSMARETGVRVVEMNLSCPNTAEGEGSIYSDPLLASRIAERVRKAHPGLFLMVKVGYLSGDPLIELLKAVSPWINGVVGINSYQSQVRREDGSPALGPGRELSGVCGWAIRPLGLSFVREAVRIVRERGMPLTVLGCGGVTEAVHVNEYLNAGAEMVLSCTGAMFHPALAMEWKRAKAEQDG